MNEFQQRARNALLGMALGDAISWPSMFHRSRLLPPWTRRIRREIDAEREDNGVLRVPMPFSLNQPAETFALCPTDDTEWAAWTMENLARNRCIVGNDWASQTWLQLLHGGERILGGVSTRTAIENLQKGFSPPVSGRDNPHYFDDGALCRAVPIGIAYAGRPDEAVRAAGIDAAVTNAEDGVWVAQALAAAISTACAGEPLGSVIAAAFTPLPEQSLSRRTLNRALAIAGKPGTMMAVIPGLHEIVNRDYSDGCVGHETLAVALAIVTKMPSYFDEAVSASLAFAKGADAIPAVVGALAGALNASDPIPEEWKSALESLKGICIPALAGRNYLRLVLEFIAACPFCQSPEARK